MRRIMTLIGLVAALLVPAGAAVAAPDTGDRQSFPTTIALPLGFPPEGIAIGGHFAYFGSRLDGSIYRADLRTGTGQVISPGPGTPSLGLKIDRRGRLFVAGGTGGDARVVDARTGRVLARYPLATPAFINDVVLAGRTVWFTDSTNPALYKLTLGPDGALPATATRVPLTGDIVFAPGINANGIVTTPDGRGLLVVQTNTGRLFRVDPGTGVATAVDLGGESLLNGDGLLRLGRTLYVVQNRFNTVTVLHLDRAGTTARLLTRVTDPRFQIPTTIAPFRDRLYLPNARFDVTPTPTTPYNAVAVPRPATADDD